MAVLALAMLAGTFAYRAFFGGYVFPALPPIVIAGAGPNDIVQNNSDTRRSNSSQTSVRSAGWSEKLQPINIREARKTEPRVISNIPISSGPSAGLVALAPAATAAALDPPVASALDQHVAPSVPPSASPPAPVSASSEPSETVAVAPLRLCPLLPRRCLLQHLSRRLPRLQRLYRLPRSRARLRRSRRLRLRPLLSSRCFLQHLSRRLPRLQRLYRLPRSRAETAAIAPAAPTPALAQPVLAAPVPPPASAPAPVSASSEPSETAAVPAASPTPALAQPVLAAPVPPPASAPAPVSASSEPSELRRSGGCAYARSCPPGACSTCPAARLGSGARIGFLGAERDCGGPGGCAYARSCPAGAYSSTCPAARLGSGARIGFLGAERNCGGPIGCARAACAFVRSCPACVHGSATRLGCGDGAAPSEPKEIQTVMVAPDGRGGTNTSSPPALAPHSATRAGVRKTPPRRLRSGIMTLRRMPRRHRLLVLVSRQKGKSLWRYRPAAPTRFS